jgi:hypothetical protein
MNDTLSLSNDAMDMEMPDTWADFSDAPSDSSHHDRSVEESTSSVSRSPMRQLPSRACKLLPNVYDARETPAYRFVQTDQFRLRVIPTHRSSSSVHKRRPRHSTCYRCRARGQRCCTRPCSSCVADHAICMDATKTNVSISKEGAPVRLYTPCYACRAGHRACMEKTPCSHCLRLGLSCVRAQPARRVTTSREYDAADALTQLAGIWKAHSVQQLTAAHSHPQTSELRELLRWDRVFLPSKNTPPSRLTLELHVAAFEGMRAEFPILIQ